MLLGNSLCNSPFLVIIVLKGKTFHCNHDSKHHDCLARMEHNHLSQLPIVVVFIIDHCLHMYLCVGHILRGYYVYKITLCNNTHNNPIVFHCPLLSLSHYYFIINFIYSSFCCSEATPDMLLHN